MVGRLFEDEVGSRDDGGVVPLEEVSRVVEDLPDGMSPLLCDSVE